jgi:tetratricopeptide (TPR) repeat protein
VKKAFLVALLLTVAGCPVPMVKSEATITAAQLPRTLPELIAYAESEAAKQNAVAMENALLAFDKAHTLDPKSYEAAWKAARAAAWLADELYNDKTKRAHYSGVGRDYAKAAIEANPNGVEGHYYSGINTGLWVTTEVIGAKFDAPKVRDAAKKASQIDPKFDSGGPYRLLGAVYANAPPWPASIGDTEKGVDYLKKALDIAPNYPLNSLLLGDAYAADGQYEQALIQYRTVLGTQPRPEIAHALPKLKDKARQGIENVTRKQGNSGVPMPVSAPAAKTP